MLNLNLKEGLYRIGHLRKSIEVFNLTKIYLLLLSKPMIFPEKTLWGIKRCRKQDQIILNLNLNVQEKKEVDNSNSDCTTVVREFKITSEARRWF